MRLCWRHLTAAVLQLLLQLTLFIDVVGGRLVVVPDNAAELTGNNVTFRCRTSTNSSVHWSLQGLDVRYQSLIVSEDTVINERFEDRFSVVNDVEGQFDLRVTNVTMQQYPGTYTCVETATMESASAVLTVLGHEPTCETPAIEGQAAIDEQFRMDCHVTYNGSLWQRPQLSWYLNSHLVSNSSHVPIPNIAVWSSYTVTARPPRITGYTCRVSFTAPVPSVDQPRSLSRSVPRYSSTCSLPVVRVVPGPLTRRPTTATTTTTTTTTTRPPEPTYLTTSNVWLTVSDTDDDQTVLSPAGSFAVALIVVGCAVLVGFFYAALRRYTRRHGNQYNTMDVIDMEWSPVHTKHF